MAATFEIEKNRKAFIYTAAIAAILLLIALYWTWSIIPPPLPLAQELIEINLGNMDEGTGTIQPLLKGEKAPNVTPIIEEKNIAATTHNEEPPAPENNTDDIKNEDAAPIIKQQKKTSHIVIPSNQTTSLPTTHPTKTINNSPTNTPSLKPQKPKIAGYNGPKNGSGNGANQDNGFLYQGNKTGGKGNAGSPKGNPDSYGNNAGGKTGVTVTKGIRPLNLGSLRFEDDFNENAKVYLDVRYSSTGTFIGASVAKGTTTSNGTILSIAKNKVANLKFPTTTDGGQSTILLNFKIN